MTDGVLFSMKELMELEALKYVLGLLQLVVTGWCVVMYNDLKSCKQDLAAHRLHMAENYTTKSESTRAYDSLSRSLEALMATVNSRFDKIDSKLDQKMDKGGD